MSFLNKRIIARVREDDFNVIRELVRDFPDVYDSNAHLIRAAVIRELRRASGMRRRAKLEKEAEELQESNF